MKILQTVSIACCLYFMCNGSLVFSQSTERSNKKFLLVETTAKGVREKKEDNAQSLSKNEIQSPFRYVVVEDDVQFGSGDEGKEQVPVRRFVTVLMEVGAFNEKRLTSLFKFLSNYYSEPRYLGIEVHTSLKTLETLEESIATSNHSSRDDFRQFYRTASYSRFDDGSEGFLYYTGKSGRFRRKFVSLQRKQ